MYDQITHIFAECLEAIEDGRLTIDQCLAKYPRYRVQLSELLQVATGMQSAPPIFPSQEVRRRSHAHLLANLPTRSPAANSEAVPMAAGLTAVLLSLLASLRQTPQKLAQKWPSLTQPAMALGISMVGALVLLLSVGLMTAVGASVLIGIKERSAAARTVSVEATQGIVELLGTDGKWTPLNKETTVTTDYRIRTGDNSSAKIIFADGRIASLGPNSEVVLSQLDRNPAALGGTITGTVTITPTKTVTATPTMTATVTITPTPTLTPTAMPGSMVTICHKPGTPAEQTKTLPIAALTGHLGHGDTLGACTGPTPTPTVTSTVTVTPTVKPTVTITPTPTITATDTPGTFVTICHKPGTPAEQTKTIPQAALNGHLGHGDTTGPCLADTPTPPPPPGPTSTPPAPAPTPPTNGSVTICHKPGTPAQQTKTIPVSALNGHLGHGDTLGACN
jgi:hypothetical protein